MTSKRPLLSVIIPTKNRVETAISAIRSVLAIEAVEVEIVVQDCGDDSLDDWVRQNVSDSRLTYHRTAAVSMTDNWNGALEHATGEYVFVIGDDDGVSREIMKIARWAAEQDLDAVGQQQRTVFYWPGVWREDPTGALLVNDFSGAIEFISDPRGEAFKASFRANIGRLVMAYHSLVRRTALEALREHTGKFFDGAAPDLYSAFALSGFLRRYALVNYPLSISGVSPKANSGKWHAGRFDTSFGGNSHLLEIGDLDWPDVLPKVATPAVLYAEAMFKAWRMIGRDDLGPNADLPYFFADAAYHGSPAGLAGLVAAFVRVNRQLSRSVVTETAKSVICAAKQLILRRGLAALSVASSAPPNRIVRGLQNIEDAVLALAEVLEDRGLPFGTAEHLGFVRRVRMNAFATR
jgi:glycosyltransferase involved in cell wall biosynthesis